MKNPHIIISRGNPFFNFGQIVDVIDESTKCFLVKDYGRNSYGDTYYTEVYPCNEMHDYEKLNRAIEVINH
jgi:hypothetical protein